MKTSVIHYSYQGYWHSVFPGINTSAVLGTNRLVCLLVPLPYSCVLDCLQICFFLEVGNHLVWEACWFLTRVECMVTTCSFCLSFKTGQNSGTSRTVMLAWASRQHWMFTGVFCRDLNYLITWYHWDQAVCLVIQLMVHHTENKANPKLSGWRWT